MRGFTKRDQLLSKMRAGENLDWDVIIIGEVLRVQAFFVNLVGEAIKHY